MKISVVCPVFLLFLGFILQKVNFAINCCCLCFIPLRYNSAVTRHSSGLVCVFTRPQSITL